MFIVLHIDHRLIPDEPEETPSGLRSPVGADFCLTFDSNRRVLELTCDIEVENTIPFPLPERLWYKDGVLVYEAKIGEIPVIREEFYQTGNNSLLMPGVISPLPLMATSDGTLFLDWRAVNLTLPDQLPTGVTEETFRMELFKTLLGTWECELENSLGESEAETTLTDCGMCVASPLLTLNLSILAYMSLCVLLRWYTTLRLAGALLAENK